MAVHQLIYYSRAALTVNDRSPLAALRDILSASQRNNAAAGITGYLIFDKVWFIQVLEGDRDVVHSAYERISLDPRHKDVTIAGLRDPFQRLFPEWSMGGSLITPEKQAIYLRHGLVSGTDPMRMGVPSVLALAAALRDYESAERSRIGRAGAA